MTKEPDLLYQAQHGILDLVEEIGALTSHLREALSDANDGNLRGAEMVAEDAISTLGNIESRSSEIAAMIAKWVGDSA